MIVKYDCRFILEYLETVKPIVKGGRFLQIKATYYKLIKTKKVFRPRFGGRRKQSFRENNIHM